MTGELPEPVSRNELRVSHSEREAVVERLSKAAAEGRLDLTELDARLDRALTARTYADLTPLTADLPSEVSAVPKEPLVIKGGLSGATRDGYWQVPAKIVAYGGMGGAKLDFTQVDCHLPEIELEVHGQAGSVTVVIPDGWVAETSAMDPGLGGLKDKVTPTRLPGTPLVRVSGTGGSGGVVVRHPNSWERRKLRRYQQG
ncbi:DUF1707 domain-containing protein [Spongiactinospora sp. TRM90649]|uniref:DUF1707 SHOCT-like domain-containing protein n=1 Tax=Spongiactinospora sp. TRM90649 TaxID=3031114 RepID=UPI0023F78EA6|nr:DUF1707 domain-containing protein [Spongiactinospora sp. TRM90649]MDF5751802.1 DUF1707 domain-containing protein [Spongiactinospora sp. TRM90649]